MNLTGNQIEAIKILRKYPKTIVMYNGVLTGGHGVKLNLNTVNQLKNKGIIDSFGDNKDRLSELGKTFTL